MTQISSKRAIVSQIFEETQPPPPRHENAWAFPFASAVYVENIGGKTVTVRTGREQISLPNTISDEELDVIPLSTLASTLQGVSFFREAGKILSTEEFLAFFLTSDFPRPRLKDPIDRHFALIPTQDRPEDLERCVKSLISNIKLYPDKDLSLLIFDDSRFEESRKQNQEMLARCQEGLPPQVSIIYQDEDGIFQDILTRSPEIQKFIPLIFAHEKSFGRARNALLLMAAKERGPGGDKVALHFFDDDTSLEDNSNGDYFQLAEEGMRDRGHSGAQVAGIPDIGFADMKDLWSRYLAREVGMVVTALQGGDKAAADKKAESVMECLAVLEKGEIPKVDFAKLNIEGFHFSNEVLQGLDRTGFGQSMDFTVATSVPYITGGSEEDHVHVTYVSILGYFQSQSSGTIHHWYGKQHGAIPIEFRMDDGVNERFTLEGGMLSALAQKLSHYPHAQSEAVAKRRSLLEFGGMFLSKAHLQAWHALLKEVSGQGQEALANLL